MNHRSLQNQLAFQLSYLSLEQLLRLQSMVEDMLLSNSLPMPDQWATPSTDSLFASREEALRALAQMDATEARSNSTYRRGSQTEGQETPSPIRMPSKSELQQLYKAVVDGNPGPAAPPSSGSDSPSKENQKPSDADT